MNRRAFFQRTVGAVVAAVVGSRLTSDAVPVMIHREAFRLHDSLAKDLIRFDILYGLKACRPDLAVRIHGA